MRKRHPILIMAAVTALLPGCAAPAGEPAPDDPPTAVRLYGTDGVMQDPFGDGLADRAVLSGMKGTAPMNPLPSEFVNRLLEIDPELASFQFAGETYDAVVISALAAELAGTPDPELVRAYITGVTTGEIECAVVAECLALARDGASIAYRGVSLPRGGFNDRGEPSAATYATMHFGRDGTIDQDKTEFVGAGDPAAVSTTAPPEPGPRPSEPVFNREPLVIGGLLPETGELSFAYPPMIAGALLAIEEINAAGGVFEVDVRWVHGDDGTDPEVARETIASHVEEGVHIIIGAAASGVTEAVLPDAVAAGRILFSPSNTAVELSRVEDDGYYFRTAPSDDLQGAALADILLRDGVQRVAIVARDDAYGRGLQGNAQEALVRYGVPAAELRLLTYPLPEQPDAPLPNLDRLVDEIVAAAPEAVLVIGFAEAAQLIQRLVDVGLIAAPQR